MSGKGKDIYLALSSYATTIVLLSLYAVVLAAATFFEDSFGTPAARAYFYGNIVFIFIQFLLVANFIAVAVRGRFVARRKWGMLLLHGSLVVILAGALITHCFGLEGMVHIRQGEKQSVMIVANPKNPHRIKHAELPFSIELKEFRLLRYPGSHAPSSYESDLVIHKDGRPREVGILMNRVVWQDGYRLYQSSYDEDEKGTVLSVNRDVAGMGVSYAGYFLLMVGVLVIVFGKNSRFRELSRRLRDISAKAAVIAAMLLAGNQLAAAAPDAVSYHAPPPPVAEQFGRLLVQNRSGRIEPVSTYSRQVLRKLHRADTFGGLTSEQVLLGILAWPEYWSNVPLIRQGSRELAVLLDNDGKYIAFNDLFDGSGAYRLSERLEKLYSKPPGERNALEKEILKLDDKANLFYELLEGRALPLYPLPGDPAGKWYSAGDDLSAFTGMDSTFVTRVPEGYLAEVRLSGSEGPKAASKISGMISAYQRGKAGIELPSEKTVSLEITYNKLDLFNRLFRIYLILGAFMLTVSIMQIIKPFRGFKVLKNIGATLIAACFLLHAFYFGLRWYISEQPPWSNAYESMVYVGWIAVLAGLFFIRRSPITTSLACLLGGLVLFVAHLNWMDPEITPLVPVLKSPWLMFHVSVITASYGFLGMCFLLGLFNLVAGCFHTREKPFIKELSIINELSMTIGICLLAVGIFLGAVWANESWGRYWGWDPKETWALITLVVYAIVLHLRLVVPQRGARIALNIGSVFAFLSVLMTYFGVNYLLGGLHSYGNTDVPPAFRFIGAAYVLIALLSIYAVAILRKREKS